MPRYCNGERSVRPRSATPASSLDALVRHCRTAGALSGRQYQTFLTSLPTFVLAAIVLRSSPASVLRPQAMV